MSALPYSRLVPCSTADKAVRATVVTSSPAYSRPLRDHWAEFTAPYAIQNDTPRGVRNIAFFEPSTRARYGLLRGLEERR
jgi:hypothetical protein